MSHFHLKEEHVTDGSFLSAFSGARQEFNWLQIDFGETVVDIGLVEVTKRYDLQPRFHGVEIKIGNEPVQASHGFARIGVNELCARYPKWSWSPKARFACLKPLAGRYLTIQGLRLSYLGIAEVHVNRVTGMLRANDISLEHSTL